MPKGLSYADAARLLDGRPAGAEALGTAVAGLASATGLPGLSLFDIKGAATKAGARLLTGLRERAGDAPRLERSRRLQAANSILVVTAMFDAFDALDLPIRLQDAELSRTGQVALAGGPAGGPDGDAWLPALLAAAVPAPGPATPFGAFRLELRQWYVRQSRRLHEHLTGLAVVDRLDDTRREQLREALLGRLPDVAAERYESAYLRLSAEIGEFRLWAWRADADARDVRLDELGAGLRELAGLLDALRTEVRGDGAGELRRLLAAVYAADLDTPVAGDEQDTGGCVLPSLAQSYLDPRFAVRAGGPGDNPADESWWQETVSRGDLAAFLAGHLTTAEASAAPLLVLGQPGSGKSALTRVLAARLDSGDFLPVRVPLREVPADAELQDQIELAVRATTGEQVGWPELARAAGGALPVVLLDGFDELLQTTGVSQSDYLLKVAKFQRREAMLNRPVAVVVTSRTAVANRAPLPEGSTIVRLEAFDDAQVEAWLAVWNRANAELFGERGLRPLTPDAVARQPELAGQPLLLLMLALYDAQDNALRSAAELSRSALYERLLTAFAVRELRKDRPVPVDRQADAVERELLQLAVVAFAMANRGRPWVTTGELDQDLEALGMASAPAPGLGFAAAQTPAERAVGRFFFIQRAEAVQDVRRLSTYEFLHATFGEYLVARLVVRLLGDVTAREAAGLRGLRTAPAHDDLLYSLLSFAPLTGQGSSTLPFARELLRPADPAVRDWLLRAFQHAYARLDVPVGAYQPTSLSGGERPARYGLNLVLLLTAGGPVRGSELFPGQDDPADRVGRLALGWQSTLSHSAWLSLVEVLDARPVWEAGGPRDVELSDHHGPDARPIDVYWVLGEGPESWVRAFERGGGFSGYMPDRLARWAHELRNDVGGEQYRHALEPLLDRLPYAVEGFVAHDVGDPESIAHSLIRVWVSATAGASPDVLGAAYERLVMAVAGAAWGPGRHPQSSLAIGMVLRMLARDLDRLPRAKVDEWVETITTSYQFDTFVHTSEVVATVRGQSEPGTLVLLCGLPGSGKTTVAKRLAEEMPAVRLCADEWLLDPFDLPARLQLERRFWLLAQDLLARGQSVILESGFWFRADRDEKRERSRALKAKVRLLYLDVPVDELARRLAARNDDRPITRDMLDAHLPLFEPPDAEELSLYDR
ncbi:AAA family ATPase [Dactylosporangium sp. CS-033363]|uniref:NACHT N-terminal helical domain 7-containing protein n=1 Tax=Dactylosporangium sp. CS-033363 TaxID=3239935 RepID=UPI003D948ABB